MTDSSASNEDISRTQPRISLAVTAYSERQRGNFAWIRECLGPASLDPLIREIVVVNDGTDDFDDLQASLDDVPKVRCFQNPERMHVFGNKLESVWRTNPESSWVLLCDSDNIMRGDYFRRLESLWPWDIDTWHCASFAKPAFDYRALCGTWSLKDVHKMASLRNFWAFANTGNQMVNRHAFLSLFEPYRGQRFDLCQPDYFQAADRRDEKWFLAYGAQDSFFLMKTWLLSGRRVWCVDGLEYAHRVGTAKLSNYLRGPAEKEALAPVYFLELADAASGHRHGYTLIKHQPPKTLFRRDDGRVVSVDMSTGGIEVG